MYFFKKNGRQMLDMRGDLVLTHNKDLIIARIKSAAPASVRNATYVTELHRLNVRGKIKASLVALGFIWSGKSKALDVEQEGM